jgi:hypothetical protein
MKRDAIYNWLYLICEANRIDNGAFDELVIMNKVTYININ